MDLVGRIKDRYGDESAKAVSGFFNAMNMPVPKKNEYFVSFDSGMMLFLTEYACIIRIRVDDTPIPHPYILQPIATRKVGGIKIEIIPGVKCPASESASIKVETMLRRDNIDYWDKFKFNIGLLPDGQPVVIDIGAVRKLSKSVNAVKKVLDTTPQNTQEKFFGSLSDAFSLAWPEREKLPDQEKMKKFWDMCKTMKQKGVLVDGWNNTSVNHSCKIYKVVRSAKKYARTWPNP